MAPLCLLQSFSTLCPHGLAREFPVSPLQRKRNFKQSKEKTLKRRSKQGAGCCAYEWKFLVCVSYPQVVAPCKCKGTQKWITFSALNSERRKEAAKWKNCPTCQVSNGDSLSCIHNKGGRISELMDHFFPDRNGSLHQCGNRIVLF